MTYNYFARGAALFVAPMIVASCGGSSYPVPGEPPESYPALVNSSAPTVSGCTNDFESCNQQTGVGVVAKVQFGDTGDIEIRFITLNDVDAESVNYNDGETSFNVSGGVGTGGEWLDFSEISTYQFEIYGEVPIEWIDGNVGFQTDASVIPTSGSATYTGGSYIEYGDFATGIFNFEFGTTNLDVNFAGEGTADLNIYLPVDAVFITEFDQIQSLGMTIDGYTFTGDQVVLLLDSAQVNEFGELTGTNTDGASAGIFFGPVNLDGNPEEFGAVAVVGGDDAYVYGLAVGGALPTP